MMNSDKGLEKKNITWQQSNGLQLLHSLTEYWVIKNEYKSLQAQHGLKF